MISLRPGVQDTALRELARMAAGKRVIEIGSWSGDSAVIFNDYFDEVYCVDTWDTSELDKARADLATLRRYTDAEVEDEFDRRMTAKMCKVKRKSPEAEQYFPDRFFDLVYLDGAHDYESVLADLKAWLPKAARYIGGHDMGTPDVNRAVHEVLMPHYIFRDSSWLARVG